MEPVGETLTVTVGHDPDGTPVIALAGELDLASAAGAERAFEELPAPAGSGPTPVVVDMTELAFMDSAGLTVLLLATKRGHALRLRSPSSVVRRLIATTGLSEILPIEP